MNRPQEDDQQIITQWRQFNFYDLDEVTDIPNDGTASFESESPSRLSITTSPDRLSPISATVKCISCDANGVIKLLDNDLVVQRRWIAWDTNGTGDLRSEEPTGYSLGLSLPNKSSRRNKERCTMLIESKGFLIGIGEDNSSTQSQFPILRIWDLLHSDPRSGNPLLVRNVRIGTGGRGYPVSCVAATANLSYLAVGLVSGQVLLYRHLQQSLLSSPGAVSTFPKARVVWEGTAAEPITGLGFRTAETLEAKPRPTVTIAHATEASTSTGLFISTTHKIVSLASVTGKSSEPKVLEDLGVSLGCSTMDYDGLSYIVGREEGIYTYSLDGRGGCYAYQGPKFLIKTQRQSLIVLSPSFMPSANSHSATIRRAVVVGGQSQEEHTKLSVFDLKNKLIAHSTVMKENVEHVFSSDSKSFHVLTASGRLWKATEISIQSKLEAVYRKSLFQLALSMARHAGLDDAAISDVHIRYGDHLYMKSDYDGAIAQYIHTLGWLQPSSVIRKFLEAHRIHHLILYLQALHAKGLATTEHTTLLLNCYTKTSDKSRLDAFLRSETTRSTDEAPPFDLETAIRVCRQAGFYDHAIYLAQRYQRHSEYMKIQLQDVGNFDAAAAYLVELTPSLAANLLSEHGKTMLQKNPTRTTDLIIEACSAANADEPPQPSDITDPRRFFPDYADHPDDFIRLLETVAARRWNQILSNSSQREHSHMHKSLLEGSRSVDASHTEHLTQTAVWNTLLELYLTQSSHSESGISQSFEIKALNLLDQVDTLPLDPTHALILCSTYNFYTGLIRLWERFGMYEDIMRFWMKQDTRALGDPNPDTMKQPSDEVIHHLNIYGPFQPRLYPLILRYLTSSAKLVKRHEKDIRDILLIIDEERVMPPLAIIQLLSRNDNTPIGSIKYWLRARVAEEGQEIDSDKQLVKSYRAETAEKLKEIASLADLTQPQVFQVTRCASCGGQLDLPSIHFMCRHSYHQRCLPDADPECPACARQHAILRELRKDQEALANRHDLLSSEIKDSGDGFNVIAGAFGRNLFNTNCIG